jgi:two-component system cell cycle sensor histidine kinase/response regulator CckA
VLGGGAHPAPPTAVDAVKRGAADYVLKDNLVRLPTSIEHALREKRAALDNRLLLKQLAQAQKMEAIGRLAGGLAHDVNNVLAAISLYAEMGIEEIEEKDTEAASQSLKNILRAQESAAGIIRQLLLFSKRDVGLTSVLNFRAVVESLQPLLKRLIGEHVELTINYATEEAMPVVADRAQIEQIVMNLAINARDAMASGGKLLFTLASRTVENFSSDVRLACAGGRFAVLTAQDSGHGMPPATLQNIFEPFFTTKEVGKGTGLGLSVIYGILQRANGTLTVQSTVGAGTTFEIFWPLANSPVNSTTQTVEVKRPAARAGSAQIILVEDDATLREPLLATLNKNGFQATAAAQGHEALKLLTAAHGKVDVLITDVIMPEMGGPELVENARRAYPELKVLFLSGYTSSYLQNHHFDPATTWFLEKPFTKSTLINKILEVLDSEPIPKVGTN